MNDAPPTAGNAQTRDDQTHNVVPAHLAVKAMRDSGYKNAAYALAKLMDNAIQAGTSEVELLCGERTEFVNERKRSRIHQIGVLDDGCGMDAEVLRLALQFGNGTRLTPSEQTGIGKFGMGLPNSSISQCRHVDVWSWQGGGPQNARYEERLDAPLRQKAQKARSDWGRSVRRVVTRHEKQRGGRGEDSRDA